MNRLKSKDQYEKEAVTSPEQKDGFDEGIGGGLQKKRSRFFRKQDDKLLPNSPPVPNFHCESPPFRPRVDVETCEEAGVNFVQDTTAIAEDKPLPSLPDSVQFTKSQGRTAADEGSDATPKVRTADLVVKKRPSLASLRKSSDRNAPPPPVPQIPINTPTPKPRRPILRSLDSVRSTRSSRSSADRKASISRPVPSAQVCLLPLPLPVEFNVPTIPFVKPSGPPPPRPKSVDWELVVLSRDVGSRMVLQTPQHTRTLTISTTSSTRSRALSRVESEEAYARPDLPSGHSSLSTSSSLTFDSPLSSPLAARFPLSPSRPLPFRDSSGSVKGYGRFSAYIKARQQYSSGTYDDGVDRGDRELGSIEQYRASRCVDWMLEKRVSGKLGDRGMLFRDRRGGWHFVADI
ncbi:hypothetical protein SVAN01_07055 [Stagonosporopsis vannaccii]|nr:hypothetical protein SVAN01_07055 [Stagonosporopsis vannaccii]